MVKRDRLGIIYNILKIIMDNNAPIKKTPLLRRSNLSSQRFSEYFDDLLGKGFVLMVKGKKGKMLVKLTDKGFRYLERYKRIIDFIDEFEL